MKIITESRKVKEVILLLLAYYMPPKMSIILDNNIVYRVTADNKNNIIAMLETLDELTEVITIQKVLI